MNVKEYIDKNAPKKVAKTSNGYCFLLEKRTINETDLQLILTEDWKVIFRYGHHIAGHVWWNNLNLNKKDCSFVFRQAYDQALLELLNSWEFNFSCLIPGKRFEDPKMKEVMVGAREQYDAIVLKKTFESQLPKSKTFKSL